MILINPSEVILVGETSKDFFLKHRIYNSQWKYWFVEEDVLHDIEENS